MVDLLREAILTGTYAPGQRLVEPEVAKAFDVSLTPVREALNALSATGLVVRNGRQGTHVRALTVDNVQNLFAVRESLECLAVQQSVQHLAPKDHRLIEDILERQAAANELVETSRTLAVQRLADLNDEFHGLILERAGNEWVTSMLASIGDLLVFARVRLRESAPWERRAQSLDEHRRIAAALHDEKVELAVRHMSDHLKHLEDHVIAQMLRTNPQGTPAYGTEEAGNGTDPAARSSSHGSRFMRDREGS